MSSGSLAEAERAPCVQDDMPAAQVQAIETFTAQQMLEAEGVMTETLDSQPLSVVLQAFWDVLLVKGHRHEPLSAAIPASCPIHVHVARCVLRCTVLVSQSVWRACHSAERRPSHVC